MSPAFRAARGPVAGGVGAAVLSWVFGVVPADAALLGLLVAAGLAVPAFIRPAEPVAWPQAPQTTGQGGWYEVRRLDSMLDRAASEPDMFAIRLAPRLRRLAAARLERHGVRWDDPEARRLLGPEVYDLLDDPVAGTAQRTWSPVGLSEQVLDRLDERREDGGRTRD